MFAKLAQPLDLSQASSVQTLPSSQSAGLPGPQPPPWHTSPTVQTLPSAHGAVLAVNTHPFCRSQASSVQTSPSSQSAGLPGPQPPPWQVSNTVQALASVQVVEFAKFAQPLDLSQASSVHTFSSSQSSAAAALQPVALSQVSTPLQMSPSSQPRGGPFWQPRVES